MRWAAILAVCRGDECGRLGRCEGLNCPRFSQSTDFHIIPFARFNILVFNQKIFCQLHPGHWSDSKTQKPRPWPKLQQCNPKRANRRRFKRHCLVHVRPPNHHSLTHGAIPHPPSTSRGLAFVLVPPITLHMASRLVGAHKLPRLRIGEIPGLE